MGKKIIACILICSALLGIGASSLFFGDEKAVTTTQEQAADAAVNTSENRQVLLCMGEQEGTMFISWKGDKDGPRFLRCSRDRYSLPVTVPVWAAMEKAMAGRYYRYTVELKDLQPGEEYYYEIGDGTVYDGFRSFRVPEGGDEDVFAYLGDPQCDDSVTDYEDWEELVDGMYEDNPQVEFVLMGGDMVNIPSGTGHWNGFLDSCGVFSEVALMTVPGNHEGVSTNNTYKKLFQHIDNGPDDEAFYWFDHGNCRFIMLDSSFLTEARRTAMGHRVWAAKEKEVEEWFKDVLATGDKRWNVVVIHHPVYGLHDVFTVSPEIRELWLPIMKEGGVDLVLCGHQHVYMRTQPVDGITYVMGVSGAKRSKYYRGINKPVYSKSIYASGANYQIIKATWDELEITSYNENGNVIDAAGIEKGFSLPYSQIF